MPLGLARSEAIWGFLDGPRRVGFDRLYSENPFADGQAKSWGCVVWAVGVNRGLAGGIVRFLACLRAQIRKSYKNQKKRTSSPLMASRKPCPGPDARFPSIAGLPI